MYKYFYTIEVNMSNDLMKAEFGNTINSMFKNVIDLEFTSNIFDDEKECANFVTSEIDKICDNLTDKHLIDKFSVETYANPHLIFGENSKEVREMTIEEKTFWKDNKLAVFAIFRSEEDEDFLIRYVIYSVEESILNPEKSKYADLFDAESPSKFLN